MDKNYFIQLTSNLYRLTLLFPKKEPLRYKIREVADEVLAKLVQIDLTGSIPVNKLILELQKDLEILDSFFEIAKIQNWVSYFDVLEIQKEYSKIREVIKGVKEDSEANFSISLSPRQEKILVIVKEKRRIQLGDLIPIFPEISRRTLIRDCEFLCQAGLIIREGSGRGSSYCLKCDMSHLA